MRNNRLFTVVLTALVLSVLAYFAADIPFFTWREPLERASLRSVNDGEPLSFSYSGDALTLHGAGENVTVYGLTLGGMAEISGGSASSFPEDSLGTMAAVRQAYQADTNNDGIIETISQSRQDRHGIYPGICGRRQRVSGQPPAL